VYHDGTFGTVHGSFFQLAGNLNVQCCHTFLETGERDTPELQKVMLKAKCNGFK